MQFTVRVRVRVWVAGLGKSYKSSISMSRLTSAYRRLFTTLLHYLFILLPHTVEYEIPPFLKGHINPESVSPYTGSKRLSE